MARLGSSIPSLNAANPSICLQFLPFPELMPFRLTPQITNLLLPHLYESGQLRNCMVHTMRALRNYHNLVLNTMDVFVKEPSLEWKVGGTGTWCDCQVTVPFPSSVKCQEASQGTEVK